MPIASISFSIAILFFFLLMSKVFLGQDTRLSIRTRNARASLILLILFLLGGAIAAWYQLVHVWPRIMPYVIEIWRIGFRADWYLPLLIGYIIGSLVLAWRSGYRAPALVKAESSREYFGPVKQPLWVLLLAAALLALVPLNFTLQFFEVTQLFAYNFTNYPISLLLFVALIVLIVRQFWSRSFPSPASVVITRPHLGAIVANSLLLIVGLPLFILLSSLLPIVLVIITAI